MRRFGGCVLWALILAQPGCGYPDKPSEISAAFREYQAAVAARDGQTAATFVAASTLVEYEVIRDLALTAEQAELERERPSFQLKALLLRQLWPPELDETADGRKVFAVFVDYGNGSEVGAQQLCMFTFAGQHPSALLQVDGKVTRRRVVFFEEEGRWKFDLRALSNDDDELHAAAREAEMPLGDYLVSLVGRITQQTPREDLWLPLQSRDAG